MASRTPQEAVRLAVQLAASMTFRVRAYFSLTSRDALSGHSSHDMDSCMLPMKTSQCKKQQCAAEQW